VGVEEKPLGVAVHTAPAPLTIDLGATAQETIQKSFTVNIYKAERDFKAP